MTIDMDLDRADLLCVSSNGDEPLEDSGGLSGGADGDQGDRSPGHDEEEELDGGVVNEEEAAFVRVRLPRRHKGEIFAIAEQLMGGSRIRIVCEDGKTRMARIPGKMKKRRWIRTGDLLVVKPWDFQNEKADVILRYTKTESNNLSRRGVIPDSINVF